MKKRLTSFLLVFALSFSLSLSAFAVDDIDYYSLPPVRGSQRSFSNGSSVRLSDFSGSDSTTLTNIYKIIQYLYLSPSSWQSNSVIGFLEKIFSRLPSNLSTNFALQGGDATNSILDGVRKWTMFTYNALTSDNISGNLGKIQQNTLASADRLSSLVSALGDGGFATENTLSSLLSFWNTGFQVPRVTNSGSFAQSWNSIFTGLNTYPFPTSFDENGSPTAWYWDWAIVILRRVLIFLQLHFIQCIEICIINGSLPHFCSWKQVF